MWALINQLAFPGLGTIMTGRKTGYVQAGIMVSGFLLSAAFFVWLIVCSLRYLKHPDWSELEYRAQYRPFLWSLWWGLALCAVAWVWALFSSAAMVRRKT